MDGPLHIMADREPDLETAEEREKFYQELVKARAAERKRAIAEGKMDDPLVPKRLEDAITIVGTCMDMCPRFERYRRERENNLFEWESIPGTKRVDHNRAVKMYERAAGDKTLPSDLRPPHVLKRTLDYLFHDLLPRGGLVQTCNFIRDRSRAVRNDFTMQHITGPLAIECHDRCARFHILTLHMVRDLEQNQVGFIQMEEQQLMNTLQSLKEFYEDQRGRYESPTELEMRVYHRLIHIRDQKERHEDIPDHITAHPVFKLTTDFRRHVQQKSAPISKTSPLVVDAEAMAIFGQLAAVLGDQGSVVMIYLVACILERLFGKDTVEDIEAIRGELTISDIIDGISTDTKADDGEVVETNDMEADDWQEDAIEHRQVSAPPNLNGWMSSSFTSQPSTSTLVPSAPPPVAKSAFAGLVSTPNVFGTSSIFGNSVFSNLNQPPTTSIFDTQPQVGFRGPAVSTSISTVPTPVAAIDPTPLAIQEDFDIINDTSTNSEADDRNFDEMEETEADDWYEDATEPQQVSPPTPIKSTSNSWLSSGSISQPLTSTTPAPPAPPALPVAISAVAGLVSGPNIFDISSIFGSSTFSGSSQPLTRAVSDTQVGFDSAAVSASTSVAPTPPVAVINPTPLVIQGELTISGVVDDISTNTKANDREVDEVVATEADDRQEDATEPKQVLPSTPLKPSSNGWLSSSFTSQPSTSTTPPTTLPVATPVIAGLVSTPRVVDTPSISGSSAFSSLNKLSTNSMSDAQPQVGFRDLSAPTSISTVATTPVVAINPTPSNGSPQPSPPAPTTQQQPLTTLSNGKRRISTTGVVPGEVASPPAQRKRVRRRISSQYHPPRTDEELAKRFKENHEEHELRWAQGSFLQVIRKHVKMSRPATLKLPWQIWLSMNPESDATAIWLERKFDIPVSGSWVSDSIFAIPLSSEVSSKSALSSSPGVIVFECTPLGDVTDNIEKKYRILDDCSRLRDIIKALPAKRRYIPSLLIVSWTDGEESHVAYDLFDMVKKLVADSVLQSYHVFAMTSATKDLDNILNGALRSLDLDLEGKLVRSLSLRGVFKLFEPTFISFLNEWIENCSTNGVFNWRLYAQLIQVCVTLFNKLSLLVQSLLEVQGKQDPLPAFDCSQLEDSESTFDDVNEWLSHWASRDDARMIAMDLQSHRNIRQDFPSRIFVEHLFEISQTRFQQLHPEVSNTSLVVPTSSITSSVGSFKEVMRHQHMNLLQTLNFSVRRSPKRRLDSIAPSEQGSPGAKRPRFAASITSTNGDHSVPSTPLINGRDSTSPTNSMISLGTVEEQPTITVAMLRALTRDMKKKYVRP